MDLARELRRRAFALALTFSRAAGFAAASPFPGGHAGPTQRVGLALALTLVAGDGAPTPDGPASPRASRVTTSREASGLRCSPLPSSHAATSAATASARLTAAPGSRGGPLPRAPCRT